MKIETYTASDGYRLNVRVWEAQRPQARVVWLHGIISHSGWYTGSCRHLARSGLEVHFLDRRGSGLNAVDRGHVDRFQTWLDDVDCYLERLDPRLPTILLGISWGGKLAAAVARHTRHPLRGLGLLCPGLFARNGPGPLGRLAVRLAGAAGLRKTRVSIPLQDPALFTDCRSSQSYIAQDPLTLREVTIAFARADVELTRYATAAPEEIRPPALLMLAGRDQIIDNARVGEFFARLGSRRRQVIEYPKAAHTFDFESDPAAFFADLAAWCEQAAGSGQWEQGAGSRE